MVSFYIRASIVALALASGCHGSLGTCRTACQPGYHRNVTCDCDKDSTGPGVGPPIYGPAANRDFKWESTSFCSMNNIVYLYNISNADVWATYSYRDRSGNRHTDQRFVPHVFRGYDDAVKYKTVLGYQYYNEANCPTADFQLIRSSVTKNVAVFDFEKDAMAQLSAKSELESRIKFNAINSSLASEKGTSKILKPTYNDKGGSNELLPVTKKNVGNLDCPKECNTGSPSINCLKGTPPDQAQIVRIHDSLMKPISGKEVEVSDIERIVGGSAVNCMRDNLKLTATGGLNSGESCAYPFFLNPNEALPSIVLHVPTTVSANRAKKNNLSIMDFDAIGEAPYLAFRAKRINDFWGGRVLNITTDADGVYYQTGGGCIALEITK